MIEKPLNLDLDEIVSIEDVGIQPTYDFTIPETHNYFANGVLVHNSGAMEEDTDTVLLLHRSDYYKERESEEYDPSEAPLSNATIIVGKNRQGPCGSFTLTWLPEIFKFVETKGD